MTLQITRIFVSDVGFDNIYAEKKTKKKEKTKDVKNASGRRSKRKKIEITSISVRTGYLDVLEFLIRNIFF